jgi:hypothetical protein
VIVDERRSIRSGQAGGCRRGNGADRRGVAVLTWPRQRPGSSTGSTKARRPGADSEADADGLYARACEMLEASDRLESFDPEGLRSWARALLDRFELGPGQVHEDVIAKAVEELERASKAEPANAETLHFWGYALMIQAAATSDENVESLLALAAERMEAALKIDPRMREALQCLAVIRMRQATRMGDAAGKTLLEEAKGNLLASEAGYAAEGTEEGNEAATWARILRSCVHARLGEEDAAFELLTAERKAGFRHETRSWPIRTLLACGAVQGSGKLSANDVAGVVPDAGTSTALSYRPRSLAARCRSPTSRRRRLRTAWRYASESRAAAHHVPAIFKQSSICSSLACSSVRS